MKVHLLINKDIARNTISIYKRRGRDILHKLKFSDIISLKEINTLDRVHRKQRIRM
jgi:hypothetical protein